MAARQPSGSGLIGKFLFSRTGGGNTDRLPVPSGPVRCRSSQSLRLHWARMRQTNQGVVGKRVRLSTAEEGISGSKEYKERSQS
jgi:hypothetical protein